MMTSAIRILYVDDNPDLLELGKCFLESEGVFTIDTVLSASLALGQLKDVQYDAIISDYEMPDIDGITFLKTLRAAGDTIPFILFTGRGREEVVIEALNNGADFYLQKGGDPASQFTELAHKLLRAISEKRAEMALKKSEQEYRQLIENTDEAICVVQDGLLRRANPQSTKFTGFSEQELLDQQFTRFVHPGDRGMLLDLYKKKIEGENVPSRCTFRLYQKDKTIRWVELNVVAISWNERPATLNFLTDITGRKLAEEERLRKNEELNASCEQIAATEGVLRKQLHELAEKQAALETSEEKFRAFTESITDFTVITDLNGILAYASPSVQRISWRESDRLPGKKILEMGTAFGLLPADIEIIRLCAQAARQKPGVSIPVPPFRGYHRHGRTIYVEGNLTFLPEVKGIWGFIFHGRDITDRKRAEDALRESEERYRRIFESFEDLYYQTDMNGLITVLSPSLYRLTGWTQQELIGKPVTDIYANPEDRQILLNEIAKNGHVRDYEVLLLRRDGTPVPTSISANRIFNPDGTPAGIAGEIRDITERKRAEDALREREQRYRTVVEDQTEFICRFLPDGTHAFVNEAYCRYFGKDQKKMIGNRFRPEIPPEDAALLRQFFASLTPENPVGEIEHRIIMPDGSTRWQQWSDRAIFGPDGRTVKEYQSVGRDITDRKDAETALEMSERYKNAIIAAMPDTLVIFSRDGVYLDYHSNDESVRTLHTGAIIGTSIRDTRIDPEVVGQILQNISLAIDTGNPQQVEYDVAHHSGCHHFEARLARVDKERVLGVIRDLTEYRKLIGTSKENES